MEEEKLSFSLDNEKLICPKYRGKLQFQLKELDNIKISYDEIKDSINVINIEIENMIKLIQIIN